MPSSSGPLEPDGRTSWTPEPSWHDTSEPVEVRAPHRPAPDASATAEPVTDAAAAAGLPTAGTSTLGISTLGTTTASTSTLSTRERFEVDLLGWRRLPGDVRSRVIGWALPLAVTLFGAVLRLWNLGRPHRLVFDETYYVKDAYSLLQHGYELKWGTDPNPAFEAGDVSGLQSAPEYVVHPPVGKWMIALGMHVGGGVESSAAWRLSSAIVGILAILMVARIARRLFSSTALGTLAGLFMAIDGEAIVHSRTALLDQFLMFFVLAAFGALLLDRDLGRRRLAARAAAVVDSGKELTFGPSTGMRWWRGAAAVLLGLAVGTKWSGLYFVAVFGLASVAWDAAARRRIGVKHWAVGALVKDAIPAGLVTVLLAAGTYVASWTGWFLSSDAWGRQWAAENPGQGVTWLPEALRSLVKYHQDMWGFHTSLETPHTYMAHPLGWIVQWRPTSFFYPDSISTLTGADAQRTCGASSCSQAVTSMGNPVIWWLAAASILVVIVWGWRRRDWTAIAVLLGTIAGWLPWFPYAYRTIFTFYSIAFTPWVILTLVWVMARLIDDTRTEHQRSVGVAVISGVTVLAIVVSIFFYPIWTAWVVPYQFWHIHMWMPNWI